MSPVEFTHEFSRKSIALSIPLFNHLFILLQIYLPQPATCPKEIYDLLLECWRKSPEDRPNFKDIHMFLQRKNHGYAPDL